MKTHGIPQGSPISDLLANMYLLNFDCAVRKILDALGGSYLRYSDDILLVAPGGEKEGKALADEIRELITRHLLRRRCNASGSVRSTWSADRRN